MSEMAQTADQVIVLGRGRVLADAALPELVRAWTNTTVLVRSPRLTELAAAVSGPDVTITAVEPGAVEVVGLAAEAIGDLAARLGVPVHELTPRSGSLEEAYLALTGESVEYKSKEIA